MKKKLDLSIDLSLEQRFQKEFVVKNKDSILLDVKIFNDRKPVSLEGNVIRLYIKKSDDTFVVQGGTDELGDNSIVISGNRLLIDVKNSATNVSGLCYGEIEIEDDEGTIATNSFVFEVVDRIGNIDKAIQSVDDIYILGEIEKFIIQAKIDMALLKEQIAEGLVKIGEFNEFVIEKTEELQSAIDKALDDITANSEAYLSKITGLSEEYGLKIERLSEEFLLSISLKADEVIETIRNERENSISIIEDTTSKESLYIRQIADSKKSEIERKANEKIAEIEIKTTEVVEAIDTKTEESIDIINTAKVDAINKIQEVEAGADIKIENLNNLITVSEEILATFDTSKSEASEIRDALTALIETSNSLKANLEAENNKATSNINELNTLHPESNTRIETLRALIEEAKKYETIVRDYIASQGGGVDLSEIHQALETLNGYIEDINNRFNNYYTKAEVDGLISNIDIPDVDMSNIYTKEEVNNLVSSYKGKIGEEKHPEFYKNCPHLAEDEEHYIRYYDVSKKKYKCVYIKKGFFDKAYLSGTAYDKYSITLKATTGRKYVVYDYDEAMSEWVLNTGSTADGNLVNAESRIDLDSTVEGYKLYSSSFDIETSSTDPTPFIGAVAGDPYAGVLGTYNVETEGSYIVEHKEAVEGCYTDSFNGVMIITNADNNIYQELISLNGSVRVYRLKAGGQWTEWKEIGGKVDLSNYYTKENIDEKLGSGKISGIIAPVFDVLPDTFTGYPENPDASTYLWEMKCTHYNHHMIFYFDTDPTGKFGIVEKADGNLGFKLLDSSFTYKTYKGYYRSETSSSGSWTAFGNNNHFSATDSRNLTAMYYHNFNIVDGNNPDEIFRVGYGCSTGDTLSDFNKAIKYKDYTVNIKSGEDVLNAPMTAPFAGILKVSNTKALVHQTFETTNGRTFKRMLNGTWTAWKEDVKKNEIENLLTSVPNKINTFTYTNADGMPEVYKWFDLNGLKIMWIDVKLSEAEYNSGSSGAMMKTLNFPAEAQIFNSIIMANITSYNRSGNDTLSRVVQNAEIISKTSVRGRWRHTDNTYPRIDRFTIMCLGI